MLRDSAERFAKEILAPHVQAWKNLRKSCFLFGIDFRFEIFVFRLELGVEVFSRLFNAFFILHFLHFLQRVSVVQAMDQKGAMSKEIVDAMFEQGLMGIEACKLLTPKFQHFEHVEHVAKMLRK